MRGGVSEGRGNTDWKKSQEICDHDKQKGNGKNLPQLSVLSTQNIRPGRAEEAWHCLICLRHWKMRVSHPTTPREAERLLENKPPGCYLVRFSESAVAFVLTYRSRSCYRHFLLAQLEDGRHVVLGEDSAHERLPDLLRHYTLCPLSPYGEHLTQPCIRQTPAPAGISMQIEHSESRSEGRNGAAQYSPVHKQEQTLGPVNKDNPGPREPEELPRPKPPVPTKPQILPELYSIPAPKASHPAPRPMPPHPIYQEPEEPIAFYAMGRGSKKDGLVNVYSEVAPLPLGHHFLQKCQSRLVTVTQTLDQGATSSLRHQPPQGHTLPPNFSRQLPQDRVQVQLLGSNKH
uniref:SH2 domain-containing protein 2A isoform X3 n=1 Tax=Phascolarctos cinereus TaxID=38626 RepID=A0A6P5KQH5_PHACI|nr:SH2 domain-containing protein 2A isoform X3 [Phascolarctos cinereus]